VCPFLAHTPNKSVYKPQVGLFKHDQAKYRAVSFSELMKNVCRANGSYNKSIDAGGGV